MRVRGIAVGEGHRRGEMMTPERRERLLERAHRKAARQEVKVIFLLSASALASQEDIGGEHIT